MSTMFLRCLFVVALVLIPTSSFDVSLTERWEKFKLDNKKAYSKEDELLRRQIWEAKMREISEHNAAADRGEHTYWLKETPWDDITYFEFMYNNTSFKEWKITVKTPVEHCPPSAELPVDLPESVDWTKFGYVTSVKDQGRCGSCWAHSVVGALEAQWYRKTGQLISLSPQSLVDCDKGNSGCGGGGTPNAFRFITENGIPSERDYPYQEADAKCKLSQTKITARIKGYNLTKTEEELLTSLAYVGPISVGLTTGPKIQNYGWGVFDGCKGPRNHAVIIVGYGTHNGMKVWKVKNSYGKEWGMDGYFYITRECLNACGLADFATYPIIDGLEYPNMEAILNQAVNTRMSFILIGSTILTAISRLF